MIEPKAEDHIALIDAAIKWVTLRTQKSMGPNYEEQALLALKRSWEMDDPVCQALALQDAQVWATLHLARKTVGYSS